MKQEMRLGRKDVKTNNVAFQKKAIFLKNVICVTVLIYSMSAGKPFTFCFVFIIKGRFLKLHAKFNKI